MLQLTAALESTTAHGLSRLVTGKPIYVRVAWLIVFCVMLGLFLNGFVDFVKKLRLNPASNSLEVNAVDFQYPDVYTCFENPISGSYAANLDAATAADINSRIDTGLYIIGSSVSYITNDSLTQQREARRYSFFLPHSLPYQLLVDSLGKKLEQSVISAGLMHKDSAGMPKYDTLSAEPFYHPVFLRCAKWVLNSTLVGNVRRGGTNSGLLLKFLLDGNSSFIPTRGARIKDAVYALNSPMPVSEWSLSTSDVDTPDRAGGLRVFLTPPGEYPSDFVTSFTLSPGHFHTVEIEMIQRTYKAGQFNCQTETPGVQFVNPYDQTPYNHSYSYSYCFYYELQKFYQRSFNMSGDKTPMPWPLRGKNYMFNLSSTPNFFDLYQYHVQAQSGEGGGEDLQQFVAATCEPKRPCSTIEYGARISSSDWLTEGSLAPFINSTVRYVWMQAQAKNLSMPALDFLFHGNDSDVVSYVRKNLVKVYFKPKSMKSDQISFSRDYGASNFISDVGGIMGIYLGMSLMTLCEVLELIYDLLAHCHSRRKVKSSKIVSISPQESAKTAN